jgi:hypothetical protein
MLKILVLAFSMLVLSANLATAEYTENYFICEAEDKNVSPRFFELATRDGKRSISEWIYLLKNNAIEDFYSVTSDDDITETDVYLNWHDPRTDIYDIPVTHHFFQWYHSIHRQTLELTASNFSLTKEIKWQCKLTNWSDKDTAQKSYIDTLRSNIQKNPKNKI